MSLDPNATGGYSLRFMQPGDEPALLQLLQAAFDGLRWKPSSNPDACRSAVVAEAESKLIAIRQFFIERIKVRNRVGLLRNGFDAAVHPDWQARGVMGPFARFASIALRTSSISTSAMATTLPP